MAATLHLKLIVQDQLWKKWTKLNTYKLLSLSQYSIATNIFYYHAVVLP